MFAWKERLIVISIGVGGGWAVDLALNHLNLSGEMNHLIGGGTVYLLFSIYFSFELVWAGKENYFHPFTLLWHISAILMVALRVLLYFLGLWSFENPGNIFMWMTAMSIQIITTLWLQKIFKIKKFGKDVPLKKILREKKT